MLNISQCLWCRQSKVNKRQVLQRAVQRIQRSELSRCFYLWKDRFGEVDDYARKRRKVCQPSLVRKAVSSKLPGLLCAMSQLSFDVGSMFVSCCLLCPCPHLGSGTMKQFFVSCYHKGETYKAFLSEPTSAPSCT